ncbi:uncharacterized protein LOC114744845 [Neltuma alba]|uniref:uncharacterized protein LOC114744845 n=1 Tax=Neltuma alba TaxID=207710 RepID=UPI0010A39B3F|nr:uncharacterized protein LOC114744845 [Prosopis alba]
MANKTWVVSVVSCFLFSFVHITKAGQDRVAKAKELEAAKLLNKMNKSAVKSLKGFSPDGDIIDCVHILHQPAFDHPKLKNHKIQYATTEVKKDKYYGAKATINVWRTHVQQHSEYSLSQIWVINQDDNDNVESVEAGWQVNPLLYGDDKPRFYAYWISDSYGRTGCYNLHCSGFVQVSNTVALGATIQPLSIYGGTQYDISLLIWKDPRSGNWSLRAQDINMGYWPTSMLDRQSESATIVQWGGELQGVRRRDGSGHPPGGLHSMGLWVKGWGPQRLTPNSIFFRQLGRCGGWGQAPWRITPNAINLLCWNHHGGCLHAPWQLVPFLFFCFRSLFLARSGPLVYPDHPDSVESFSL